jgi:protein CpxP
MKLASISMAAALALCAGASFAQPAPQGPPGAEGRHWQRPDPAQMAERHAQRLRDTLQLRPDQEPALRALIAASQRPAGEHGRMGKGHEEDARLSTPERLDHMQAAMAEHAAHFRAHAEATKRFYAQLSPTQQRAFDAMPMGRHEHGGHGRGGPGERMHGPHGGPPPAQGL